MTLVLIVGGWVLMLLGAVVAVIVALWLCVYAREEFLDWRHEPHARSFDEGCEHVRNRLLNDAWWFGESPETMRLVQDLARGVSVAEARDNWRKVRDGKVAA